MLKREHSALKHCIKYCTFPRSNRSGKMSIAASYPIIQLYIMLLSICVIVAIAVFWKYPSLRVYRRKRNVAIYTIVLLVFGLIAYQAYNASLGPNFISFSIQKTQNIIYVGEQNHFFVTCRSEGAREVHFYMTINAKNATLQTNGHEGYIQLNETAIKIPFTFHGNGEQAQPVFFTVNPNVSSISFYPRIERLDGAKIAVMTYLSEIQCTFDPSSNSYVMAASVSQPTAVP